MKSENLTLAALLILWLLFIVFCLRDLAFGQTTLDYDKANFMWDYNGPAVDGFRIKCGTKAGVYSISKDVLGNTPRSYPVKQVLPATVATYDCILSPYHKGGEATPVKLASGFAVSQVWRITQGQTVSATATAYKTTGPWIASGALLLAGGIVLAIWKWKSKSVDEGNDNHL